MGVLLDAVMSLKNKKRCTFCGCYMDANHEGDICECCLDELYESDPGDSEEV